MMKSRLQTFFHLHGAREGHISDRLFFSFLDDKGWKFEATLSRSAWERDYRLSSITNQMAPSMLKFNIPVLPLALSTRFFERC